MTTAADAPTLGEVVALLHGWFPPETADEWDAVGLVLGLCAALATGWVLRGVLCQVSAIDPLSYGIAAVAVGAVALGASWWPTRRALRADPFGALLSDAAARRS